MLNAIMGLKGAVVMADLGGMFTTANSTLQTIINGLNTIIGSVATIAIAILAIRWLIANDPQTVRQSKQSLFWIVIALIVYYGAQAIISAARTIGQQMN